MCFYTKIKNLVSTIAGCYISAIVNILFGSFTDELKTLLLLIVLDLICGLVTAGVFKNSTKTSSGGLNSSVMTKGVFKKIGILVLVVVSHYIDITLKISYVMYATEIALIVEEVLSIIENIGLMGVPIPSVISNAIDLLNKKINDVMKGE